MKFLKIFCLQLIFFPQLVAAKPIVEAKEVTYKINDQTFVGYVAKLNHNKKNRPGLLIVHEWWGNNQFARTMAKEFARIGYVALAIDMYGEGQVETQPKKAIRIAQQTIEKPKIVKQRFLKAMEVLQAHPNVHPKLIATIGYSFGGEVALQMARENIGLISAVSFHAKLNPQNISKQDKINPTKVFVAQAGADSYVSQEDIPLFKQEMQKRGIQLSFISYPNALHSFTNPVADEVAKRSGLNIGYSPKANDNSWYRLKNWLKKNFRRKRKEMRRHSRRLKENS